MSRLKTATEPCCSTEGSVRTSVSSRCPLELTRPNMASTRTSPGLKPASSIAARTGTGLPLVSEPPRPLARQRVAAPGHPRMPEVRRIVKLAHVLAHHPPAIEIRADVSQRFLDPADPFARRLLAVLVEHRHDFVFQHRINRARVQRVLIFGVRLALPDRPSAAMLVGLVE